MIVLTRRTSVFTGIAMLAALAAVGMTLGAQAAPAASYKKCSLSERDRDPPGEKPTYNLTLKQQRTKCATAKRVMRAFHSCRSKTSYRCTKRILRRWRCSARKTSSIPTQFNATFTCKWGKRRVQSSYQQYT